MKLTEKQRQHLLALDDGAWRSAYPKLHMGVLNSLSLRGLVSANHSVRGALFSPSTAIKWRITDAGRRALAEQEGTSRE